ncbi:hypothetical protein FJV83_19630 [Mesorhizobium sp. WSM4307]|uniref:hypothetical protein n=1 Tax=unclassified Mesorhizobium TaxID=325217 RepID=UPI000BAFDDA9|nr:MULTISPECIES: hypothetical protein [unclassified Mesorhizobium]PBB22096.1 hypothetical protein CK232_35150 [Mesorhizobium sp. WSM4304]PBB70812.1 hypothetical protein CK227_35485 [Mesorhizobium sp. WSM4308]TRC72987.1 hypothetical protein FJV81_26095 [Mesorhizobium sp. WSM4315]TRC83641.1 hypothetical protein FJV83_19630 [Mesorhizobium sp. WSM4307]
MKQASRDRPNSYTRYPQCIGESRVPSRSFEKDVQIPLQYLAAATLMHWQEIPEAVRTAIVETATSGAFPDLPRSTSLHEQIARLVRYSGENRDQCPPDLEAKKRRKL